MGIGVYGIGWVSPAGFGSISKGLCRMFEQGETLVKVSKEGLFLNPIKNFGRLDSVSRLTLAAVSLCMQDAGMDSSSNAKCDAGIVGTSTEGSLASDLDYFRDYVENGRKLSRANLFIYTLPSSPLGEAAIHFGLTGPLLFTQDILISPAAALNLAAAQITDGAAEQMLAGKNSADSAIYLLLSAAGHHPICTLNEAAEILEGDFDIPRIVTAFKTLTED